MITETSGVFWISGIEFGQQAILKFSSAAIRDVNPRKLKQIRGAMNNSRFIAARYGESGFLNDSDRFRVVVLSFPKWIGKRFNLFVQDFLQLSFTPEYFTTLRVTG